MPIWSPAMIFGSATSGYVVENSLWFDGSADYLTKTFGSTGTSRTVYTVSFWARQNTASPTGGNNWVIDVGASGGNSEGVRYTGSGEGSLYIQATDGTEALNTGDAARFRDLTAWQHVVWARNTGNADGNKNKLYVNGVRITSFDSSYGTRGQNLTSNGNFGGTDPYSIGRDAYGGTVYYNGYLAEFAVIDGTEYAASDFGEFDDNGVWIPKDPSGLTYGDNGFLLQFKQTGSGQDSSGIGADTSGKDNHFAVGGGSIQTNQVTDTCTDDANNNVGNYATFNPHDRHGSTTLADGNLHANGTTTHEAQIRTTIALTGKKYWEIEADTLNADAAFIGILKTNTDITTMNNHSLGTTADGYSINCSTGSNNGKLFNNNTNGTDLGTIANGDVISVAFDADTRKLFFGKNGSWLGSADPANGTNPAYTASVGTYTAAVSVYTTSSLFKANFGQTAFSYTVPTGFDAGINTANLPAPTVTNPSDFFKTVLYTGNGGDKSVTGVGFQPDFVWIKCRSVATNWNVVDVVRGADAMLRMASSTNTEQSGANQEFESFDADGFTVTHHGGVVEELNRSSATYVAYCMKAGGAASSNGNGSITSQVSAASHGGFSIITYTGDGNAGATIGHGLSQAAEFQIFKRRTPAQDYHVGTNITGSITGYEFNNATASVTAAVTAFNATTTALDSQGVVNDEDDTYVSYAFARTPGLIGIGSYTGNNSADGPYIVIDDGASGFRPAWVMIKRIGSTGNWVIRDAVRNPYNPVNLELYANATDADYTEDPGLDFTANGFKLRDTAGAINASDSYIYLAFAENPFGGDGVAQAKAR
jgi:hypothetical protein